MVSEISKNKIYRCHVSNRSSILNQEHVGYCGVAKKVFPVGRWRSAPACCAAQSVMRRGPCYFVPLQRLAWAAQTQLTTSERHSSSKRSGNSNASVSCLTRNWRQAVRAVWPNHSLNRTHCGRPPFGLGFNSPDGGPPQWVRLSEWLGRTARAA